MNLTQKKTRVPFLAVLALAVSLTLTAGCASHSRTYKNVSSDAAGQTVVEETATHTAGTRDRGILGGAFHVVGEILAFPFDVVAGVFRFIF
jgi:hypothetical protein